MKKILLSLTLIFFFLTSLYSTHLAGGDITYVNVGQDAYKVTLSLYGDCTGNIILFRNTKRINITSASCSINTTETLQLDTTFEVSAICPSNISNSRCGANGNLNIAYNVYIYSKIISLQSCNDYVISFRESARNGSISNLFAPGTRDFYVELTANLVAGRNNSSAQFFAYPTPTFLTNTIGSFNNASYDPDRDSLYYELIDAKANANVNIPYNNGYLATNPIRNNNTFNFNSATGLITVIPTQEEVDAVAMKISEYKDGILLGTTIRDIQINVQKNTSNNKLPQTGSNVNDPPEFKDIIGGYKVINTTYPAYLTELDSVNSFRICPGDSLILEIEITDPNVAQNLNYIRSNYNLAIPGSKLTINKTKNNKIKAKFEWFVSSKDIGFNSFSIIVGDNQCDYFYKSYFTYNIQVNPKIDLGPKAKVICGKNDRTKITINYPGKNIKWHTLEGDSIQVGVNFSCDTCRIAYAKPSFTTTYYATSSFPVNSYFCDTVDTITIHVIPDYLLTTIASDSSVCRGEEFSVSTFPSPIVDFEFNYSWSPKYAFDNPNSKSSKVKLTKSGLQTIYVTADNRGGCEKKDSIQINVSQGFAPDIEWLNKSNIIPCPNSIFNFITRPGLNIPANCGVSSTIRCEETSKIIQIGESRGLININNSLPAPMANSSGSIKQQFLYKREELINSGFIGGKITALSFFVTGFSLGNIGDSLKIDDISIKMGCIRSDSLKDFIPSLSPVSGSPLIGRNFTAKKGWNQISFQVGYEWDGQSNIVVEICTRVNTTNTNQNPTFLVQETNFPSFQRATSNNNACAINTAQPSPNIAPWNTSGNYNTRRPLTRFKYCDIFGDPLNYTYKWTPSKFLNDSTIHNPQATISKSQKFSLTITEISHSCSDSDTYEVIIGCCTKIKELKITDSLCPSDSSGILEFRTFGESPPYRVIITNSKNDTLRNILTSSLFSLGNLYPDTFKIKIIDKKECIIDTLVFIKPLSLEEAILGIKPTCPGDLIKVSVDTVGKGYSTLKWSNGSTSNTTQFGVGNITLFITKDGCTYPIKGVIPKAPVPNSNFTINPPSNGYTNETVTFTARDDNAISYTWDLGGGSSPKGNKKIVINNYSNSQVYNIQLITENRIGCKDTTTVEYAVLGNVDLPNVITPNGDGKNDVLIIADLKNVAFENTIRIFNRWGKLVYKENNYKDNWSGSELNSGTYFYTLTIKDSKKTTYKGYIELIK